MVTGPACTSGESVHNTSWPNVSEGWPVPGTVRTHGAPLRCVSAAPLPAALLSRPGAEVASAASCAVLAHATATRVLAGLSAAVRMALGADAEHARICSRLARATCSRTRVGPPLLAQRARPSHAPRGPIALRALELQHLREPQRLRGRRHRRRGRHGSGLLGVMRAPLLLRGERQQGELRGPRRGPAVPDVPPAVRRGRSDSGPAAARAAVVSVVAAAGRRGLRVLLRRLPPRLPRRALDLCSLVCARAHQAALLADLAALLRWLPRRPESRVLRRRLDSRPAVPRCTVCVVLVAATGRCDFRVLLRQLPPRLSSRALGLRCLVCALSARSPATPLDLTEGQGLEHR
mmetsp:Transcript_106762/g.281625  ORF Transcript_106762/g.281625 Transcript_106762/m.281625 type:complete len:348 (+) Transcript_106762:609-1652(+)